MEADILFVQPSFLRGMARTLDIGGQLDDYNYSKSEKEADNLALSSDWVAIEKDFWSAFETVQDEIEQVQKEVKGVEIVKTNK